MVIKAGNILTSTAVMDDPNFLQTLVFIAKHDDNGAIGFITNKLFGRELNELEEFKDSPNFPLYEGGPVDKEHLYFIHRCNDRIHGGELISEDVFLGGDFSQAVTLIKNRSINTADIKIFIGYCGWDANELESEITEGSWTLDEDDSELVFEEGE